MIDTEIFRIAFVLGILAVNTFTDLRSRTIFGNDKLYLVLGIAGLSLLVIDKFDVVALFWICLNLTVIAIAWRVKTLIASGDLIVYLVMAFTIPMESFFIVIGAFVIQVIFGVLYNWTLNIKTLHDGKPLFTKYKESKIKKAIAFSLFHQKRNWEKHVVSVEKGKRFSLTSSPMNQKFNVKDGLVQTGFPFMAFMLAALLFFLFLTT